MATEAAGSKSSSYTHMKRPVVSVPLHVGLFPVLDEISKTHGAELINVLKESFSEAEQALAGFTQEIINGVIQKEAPNEISFTKSLLRMSGEETKEYTISYNEAEFVHLSGEATFLKQILSRIPDEISDRPRFLQTIKDIASAIKDLLAAVNDALRKYTSRENKKMLDMQKKDFMLDMQKKDFVRCSKSFSDTLKAYFRDRDGSEVPVFASANRLIHQTNSILVAFKSVPPD